MQVQQPNNKLSYTPIIDCKNCMRQDLCPTKASHLIDLAAEASGGCPLTHSYYITYLLSYSLSSQARIDEMHDQMHERHSFGDKSSHLDLIRGFRLLLRCSSLVRNLLCLDVLQAKYPVVIKSLLPIIHSPAKHVSSQQRVAYEMVAHSLRE